MARRNPLVILSPGASQQPRHPEPWRQPGREDPSGAKPRVQPQIHRQIRFCSGLLATLALMMDNASKVKVLYIAGTGRSGSTLLANILGQIDGFFDGGEIRYLWQRGILEDRLCGCGLVFSECPMWTTILKEAGIDNDRDSAERQVANLHALTRVRNLPAVYLKHYWPSSRTPTDELIEVTPPLAKLYTAIKTVTNCDVIIDSSKLPTYAHLLSKFANIDLYVVHLLRDPQAAAYSWVTHKAKPDMPGSLAIDQYRVGSSGRQFEMERLSSAKSALLWDLWHVVAETACQRNVQGYMALKYEDFVAQPQAAVTRILEMLGEQSRPLDMFTGDTSAELHATHSVAGNPDRLKHGQVELRQDDRWRTKMATSDRATVGLITAPFLAHFDYPRQPRLSPVEAPEEAHFPRSDTKAVGSSLENESGLTRSVLRVGRHINWIRDQGLSRIVEEDRLDPIERASTAFTKWQWRRQHVGESPGAVPIWIVGAQRSGTNMILRGLEALPEIEVRNENDRQAFDRFRLRDDSGIARLIAGSAHKFILFKPLCDSQRIDHLLDDIGFGGKAIWAYRNYQDRARSAVAKFGAANWRILRDIAAGNADGSWQGERISDETLALVKGFDFDTLSEFDAAALFWYVRNVLYFELALDERPDVRLVSYDDFVDDADQVMQGVCRFVDIPYSPNLIAHVGQRHDSSRTELPLNDQIRDLCDSLQRHLDAAIAFAPAG